MKRFLIAALLVAGPSFAQDSPFLKDEALKAEIAKSCADGCIVFNAERAEAFERLVNAELARRMQAAFDEGMRQGKLICRNAT